MIEVIRDLDEFKEVVRAGCRLRYQIMAKPQDYHGVLMGMELQLEIYGIAPEGHIVKYEEFRRIRNAKMKTAERFWDEDVEPVRAELAEKAEKLGAKKGCYLE